ncbi:uncharacterized protein LOC110445289 [Mizuhopecten yessoensis]|uniref:N,N'-diacetylchitobiase n=1 Tax=Mizuhopecten yessoensis TaxID=6573 RepID=A0A210R083_MIZYE|nr:uncharacterized protein LOC110445289 [Mizuhopecten yessoensis]OWF54315.1 N,N'-diacetylchitobiase [Mizuhopecten yessoensis]
MQATISTRKVLSGTALFQLLFPRLIAFAERAWHRASWENTVKRPIMNITAAQIQEVQDFMKFKTILGKKILPKLDKNKVQYYMAPPGVIMRKVTTDPLDMKTEVMAKTEYPGFVAQIKTDQMPAFADIVDKGVYDGALAQFRTRNKDSTRFSRSEVVFKNGTDKYMREHVDIMKHLDERVSLEFPIQTRFRNQDDPSGKFSFSLQDSLPLYFDKEFRMFFNKTGHQEFLRNRPALVEQAKLRQQQHIRMMQEHQRRMMTQNAARANNPNSMNQGVGNTQAGAGRVGWTPGNNQGGAGRVGWGDGTPGNNQNSIQSRQTRTG